MGLRHTTRSLFLRSEGLAACTAATRGDKLSLQGTATACIFYPVTLSCVDASTARPAACASRCHHRDIMVACPPAGPAWDETNDAMHQTTCPNLERKPRKKPRWRLALVAQRVISDGLVAWYTSSTTVLADLWRINVLACTLSVALLTSAPAESL